MGTDPNDKRLSDGNTEKREFFLNNVIQLRNNAVLFEKNDAGFFKCIFASDEFSEMMECSIEEAVALMNRPDFETTHIEDRPALRAFIQKRSTVDNKSTITVRKITAKGNIIWCSIHCAFIDDFGTGYIYCTYNDVTAFKEYEDRMRNSYTELGDRFYREDESTLGMFQVNLTKDYCEDIRGKDLFVTDCDMYTYSEIVRLRAGNFPILTEQEAFLNTFGPGNLLELYKNGTSKISMFLFSKRSDGTVCYVNYTAVLTTHPTSGNTIAFITEKECNRDKVNETLTNKILAKQFDMVAYIANGKYGVVIGDASNIERGGIFPHSKSGEYDKYISSQVKPVL
ncbi:MAG: PAS domain-containing protein, partial [Lachnospiraceae bacterium]|nr:PAS domain-containing protein [Lachnospiraceae bacterium]